MDNPSAMPIASLANPNIPPLPPMDGSMNQTEQQVMNAVEAQEHPASTEKKDVQEFEKLASLIVDLDRRLRVLEERYSNLRKKLQLTDQNFIESERSFSKELREFNQESMDLKRTVNDFSDKIIAFDSEMKNTAKISDVKIIERYLALWNPINFVTRSELKKYLQENAIKIEPILTVDNQ